MKSMEQDAADIEEHYRDILSRRAASTGLATSRGPASHASEGPGRMAVETSIVIPVWNNLELTRQCLESIWQNTPADSFEVIVVDNGSTDCTTEFLYQEQTAGRLRAVFNKQNLGFAKACNQGARAARGDYLVFLNNDTIVTQDWLEELINCAKKDGSIAIVGAKLLFPDDTVQHAGAVFNNYKKVYHIYRNFHKDHPAVNKEREFQTITAACMLIKKDLFFKAGLFEEGYQNGFEDVDLCLTIKRLGYKIFYTPKSVVYHLESKTPGRFRSHRKHA